MPSDVGGLESVVGDTFRTLVRRKKWGRGNEEKTYKGREGFCELVTLNEWMEEEDLGSHKWEGEESLMAARVKYAVRWGKLGLDKP